MNWGGASIIVNDILFTCGGAVMKKRVHALKIQKEKHWEEKEKMLIQCAHHAIALVFLENERIYTLGGNNGCATTNSCQEYDIASDSWSMTAPLNESKSYIQSCVVNNQYIFAFGGNYGLRESRLIERYNVEQYYQEWKILSFLCPNEDSFKSMQLSQNQIIFLTQQNVQILNLNSGKYDIISKIPPLLGMQFPQPIWNNERIINARKNVLYFFSLKEKKWIKLDDNKLFMNFA